MTEFLLQFVGGRRDGEQFLWPEMPQTWRFPLPVPAERMMDEIDPTRPKTRALVYKQTDERLMVFDRVRGCVYEFAGYER